MDNFIEVNFAQIPFSKTFEYKNIEYIKTNFSRGFYWDNGIKIFRNFKKKTKVKANKGYFDFIPLIK